MKGGNMKRKTLKDKIDNVIFWAVVFIILYFIVGFMFESLWLSKSLKLNEVYELLKDTLSLTAAFLAPAAAFVLFSDWREQHIEKSLEEKSKEINNTISLIYKKLLSLSFDTDEDNYMNSFTKADFHLKSENIYNEISDLLILIGNFDRSHEDSEAFLQAGYKVYNNFMICLVLIERMFGKTFMSKNPSEFNCEYVDEDDEDFIQRCLDEYNEVQKQWNEMHFETLELSKKVAELRSKFQIKN